MIRRSNVWRITNSPEATARMARGYQGQTVFGDPFFISRRAKEKRKADWKMGLQFFVEGTRSTKRPTPVVGKNPNGK
jgi:hypothetical protein